MILQLSKEDFDNNIFSVRTNNECTLVLNSVQETFRSNGLVSDVNTLNIQLFQEVGGILYYEILPTIIGLENEYIKISSDYKELEGTPLTVDNIDKCILEVSEESIRG